MTPRSWLLTSRRILTNLKVQSQPGEKWVQRSGHFVCLNARARDCPHHFGRRLVGSRSQTWGTARDAIDLTRHTFSHKSSWSINHHRSMRAHFAPGTVEGMGVKPEGGGFTDVKNTPHRAHADGSRPKGEMSRCRARAPRRMGHGSPDSEVPWPLSFLSQGHPNHAKHHYLHWDLSQEPSFTLFTPFIFSPFWFSRKLTGCEA